MSKVRLPRFIALLATTAAAVSLIGIAIGATGAYFTASQPGSITGNLGTVAVTVSGANINFANLLPGQVQTQTVTVTNTGTGNEDIWLAFDNTNLGWSAVNDLGQYGKFVINGNTYDNLNNQWVSSTPGVSAPGVGVMSINPLSGCYNVPRVAINYLPHVIFLGTLTPSQVWTFGVSFNFNACMTGGNGTGAALWSAADSNFPTIGPVPLNFKVAAFQPGVNPNDQMNGSGKIAPLNLPIAGDVRTIPGPGIYQ